MSDSNSREIAIDLPFDPSQNRIVISQGFNSPFSHKPSGGIDLTHSVDFALEPGTPVTAVQDGIVRLVQRYTACYRGYDAKEGRNNWASSLEILSASNPKIYSLLQHLNPESIQVTQGQQVTRGQLLATTGLTGWVGPIPHLHISMMDLSTRPRKSIPFWFRNYPYSLDDSDVEAKLNEAWPGTQKDELFSQILEARDEARRIMIRSL